MDQLLLPLHNPNLIRQVAIQLQRLGIQATASRGGERVYINSDKEIRAFLQKIGFSNPRHANKLSAKIETIPA